MTEQQAPLNEFQGFGKIARLRRNCIITEKIDGTNAAVTVDPTYDADDATLIAVALHPEFDRGVGIRAQSRNKFIDPSADNAGFARWVADNASDLALLGPGRHYGEWWGQGIQRRYGLDEKRFSLFNASRWGDDSGNVRPACCHVVPVLYEGIFTTEAVDLALESLRLSGSLAAPGFDRPEGVIVYQVASKTYGKVLLENDELPKSVAEVRFQ